ncbi:MAG TPA: MFS transporter [Acetobacteraceae bacterium]|jgi:MFS family permease|nr:MFS transporter [Acetobacteraceae bacterium]
MTTSPLARLCSGRVHYAWVTLAVIFTMTLAVVGVRSAPGVMIVPLQRAFGWNVGTISGAVSLNILLMGVTGPFLTGLMESFGLKRTILLAMLVLLAGSFASCFMTTPWELYVTWGLMIGVGAGAGAVGMAAAVANRWFMTRRGLVMGLLTAANATGQLIFLPVLAALAQHHGWRSVSITVTLAVAVMIPVVALLLAERPSDVGLLPYGATEQPVSVPSTRNPFTVAIQGLRRGLGSLDFWLLTASFSICGLSTNGLIGTHLIAYCVDHGIPEVTGASFLASFGIFNMMGATASGWFTDRYNPRVLLFWYFGLRGLSLVILPFTPFDVVSLSAFALFYGLDWIATVPPTFALTNAVFGRRDGPVMMSWIYAGHQVGGAVAAVGAGAVRGLTGSYLLAFLTSGMACLLASLLVLRIARAPVVAVAAE